MKIAILNKKNIFLLAILIQLFLLIFLVSKPLIIEKSAIKQNRILKIPCTLYDPFNVMKGRYVKLFFPFENLKLSENLNTNKIDFVKESSFPVIYAVFENGKITEISYKKPDSSKIFIKTSAKKVYDDEIHLNLNFDEFYVQEDKASEYEKKLRTKDSFLELYVDKNGNAIQKDLVFEDRKEEGEVK